MMAELLQLGNLAQNSGGLLLLMVVIWMDLRHLKASVLEVKDNHAAHEERYVHTERRSAHPDEISRVHVEQRHAR